MLFDSNKHNSFKNDVAITFFGQSIVLILVFAVNKVLSIKLGVDGFGEFNIAKRTTIVLSFFMVAGLGIAIPKYLATYRQLKDLTREANLIFFSLVVMISFSIVVCVSFFAFRTIISRFIFGGTSHLDFILPMILYANSIANTNFVYSFFRGAGNFYIFNFSQVAVQLLTFILAYSLEANVIKLFYAWSYVNYSFSFTILFFIITRYLSSFDFDNFKKEIFKLIKDILGFCIPRIPGEIILFSYTVAPIIIINHKMGLETTGLFSAAITINHIITPFFGYIGLILLPRVSSSIANNNFNYYKEKIEAIGGLFLLISISTIITVELFTSFLIRMVFSPDFLGGISIIRIMILSILPQSIYLLLRNPIDALSHVPYNTINLLVGFIILNLLVFFFSNTKYIALSFVISYWVVGVLTFFSWRKCSKQ